MTVKVRNDPEPTLPETVLGTGVEGVEVGVSGDVAVTARVAILRLREQTFILVKEMSGSLQAVLFGLLDLKASWLESAALPSPRVTLRPPSQALN